MQFWKLTAVKATETELELLAALRACRFQPGSFDKKLPREIDPNDISPRQRWYLYKLGYKYRKQIGVLVLEAMCLMYITEYPEPLSRREAEKILKQALKDEQSPKLDI
jgi:hypothetical protein